MLRAGEGWIFYSIIKIKVWSIEWHYDVFWKLNIRRSSI